MTGVGKIDNAQLLKMSFEQLDELFGAEPGRPDPERPGRGHGDHRAGTAFSDEIARIINIFAWRGKEFDAEHGTLTNRLTAIGINAIVAQIYKEPSWFDQQECIVLDYSKTSLVAQWIRDEIRLIGPDFYLGRVYWDKRALIHFSLDFAAT